MILSNCLLFTIPLNSTNSFSLLAVMCFANFKYNYSKILQYPCISSISSSTTRKSITLNIYQIVFGVIYLHSRVNFLLNRDKILTITISIFLINLFVTLLNTLTLIYLPYNSLASFNLVLMHISNNSYNSSVVKSSFSPYNVSHTYRK